MASKLSVVALGLLLTLGGSAALAQKSHEGHGAPSESPAKEMGHGSMGHKEMGKQSMAHGEAMHDMHADMQAMHEHSKMMEGMTDPEQLTEEMKKHMQMMDEMMEKMMKQYMHSPASEGDKQ